MIDKTVMLGEVSTKDVQQLIKDYLPYINDLLQRENTNGMFLVVMKENADAETICICNGYQMQEAADGLAIAVDKRTDGFKAMRTSDNQVKQ